MGAEERLERLEQRVAVLETLLRGQLGAQPKAPAPASESSPASAAAPAPRVPPPRTPTAPGPSPLPPSSRPLLDTEEWLGQKGLLALGVVALILAAGYLLKLSFERGWISPPLRCAGGFLAGAIVGGIGWRLEPRYRTYGASLIGCGAAIMYLVVWAATSLYQFFPAATGIAALALVSLGLAAIAFAFDVEALGTTAALGAFFAPIVLGRERHAGDPLLLYLACMAAALGWVAARRRWRLAAFVIAASFFGLATPVAEHTTPFGLLVYAVGGGVGGLYLGLRERWWETRFLSFWGGWGLVAVASDHLHSQPLLLIASLCLAAPVWWNALRRPFALPALTADAVAAGWSVGELVYFLSTPLLLGWAVHRQAPELFNAHRGLVPLIVALPYVLLGWLRPLPRFTFIGALGLGWAALAEWHGLQAVPVLLLLGLATAGLDHLLRRDDGRWYALLALVAALLRLYARIAYRGAGDAFVGHWPVALWALIAVTVALAAGLWRRTDAELPGSTGYTVRGALWFPAGALLFLGVGGELSRFFNDRAATFGSASLAAQLSVSAWWLVFAAALVSFGFYRNVTPARWAGLAVAGAAGLKVILSDLASLDALWRVASVFLLGLISLALAYLYHRERRAGWGDGLSSAGMPDLQRKELP
jgi:uncharacterized membrane protein